jgi:hypothetical protein
LELTKKVWFPDANLVGFAPACFGFFQTGRCRSLKPANWEERGCETGSLRAGPKGIPTVLPQWRRGLETRIGLCRSPSSSPERQRMTFPLGPERFALFLPGWSDTRCSPACSDRRSLEIEKMRFD